MTAPAMRNEAPCGPETRAARQKRRAPDEGEDEGFRTIRTGERGVTAVRFLPQIDQFPSSAVSIPLSRIEKSCVLRT